MPPGARRTHRDCRPRTGDDINVVVVAVVPVRYSLADDVGQMLVQCPPEGDVEHLMTAAHRQHRLVLGDRSPCQRQVESVVLVADLEQPRMEVVDAIAMR